MRPFQATTRPHFESLAQGRERHAASWTRCRRSIGAAALAISVLPIAGLRAAETDDSAASIPEILVTAQKITENVQKVPISMTVISADTLVQQGSHDFQDVLTEVPNLSFEYGTAGAGGMGMSSSRGITIRGISGTNTTSVYIDDTPVPVSIDPRLLDIDHIEVLKGPQGTLYGQASMGGTVKITTARPSPDSFGGTVSADGHNVDGGGFGTFDSVSLNIPLSPDLAMRVGSYASYEPGFLTRTYDDPSAINGNFVSGPPETVSHVGSASSYGASASLRFAPEDMPGLVVEPKFMGEKTFSNGFLATDNSTTNYTQRRALNVPENWTDTFYLASAAVHMDTGIGKLISATSYFYRDSADHEDGSDVIQQLFGLSTVVPAPAATDLFSEQFTQELRLESDIGTALKTTAGLYFNDALSTYDENIYSPGANAASGGTLGTDVSYLSHQPGRASEKAVFLSATYSVTDQLKVTAGARDSFIHQENWNNTYGYANGGYSSFDLSHASRAVTPRFSAQYQITDNHMVYATAAKGFRPGGTYALPDICAADLAAIGQLPGQQTFNSDSLWNYEVGAKTRWLGGRIVVNAAAYDMEWSDIQQAVRLPVCGFTAEVNGASARSSGSELEIMLALAEGLTFGASAGYEEAKITGVSSSGSGNLYVGQPLNGVPKTTGAANLKYEHATSGLGRAFFRVDYDYVGSSLGLSNSPVIGRVRPSYALLDLRVGTTIDDLQLSLYGKNVTNSHPNLGDEVSEIVETFGRPRYVVGPPTVVGVEIRKKF
jgi:outer membrane receptor protein involved in Fe transport